MPLGKEHISFTLSLLYIFVYSFGQSLFFLGYFLQKTDPTRNNFVTLPSCISKLTKLELLILNLCKKLQRLPELPSSMQQLDASNCTSLETSKFNPSKPRSLFASPAKLHFPRELKGHLPRELIGLFEVCTLVFPHILNLCLCVCVT